MRLIYTVPDQLKGRKLSTFLSSQGIDNQLEIATNTDWGSHNYGDSICKLWVIDEDVVDQALEWVHEFEKDPENPKFNKVSVKLAASPPILTHPSLSTKARDVKSVNIQVEQMGRLTLGILFLCCIIFIISEFTTPFLTSLPKDIPYTPLVSAPIKKQLYYDYPQAYELIDKLVKLYGIDRLQTPQELPPEGQYLLAEFHKTTYWQGGYDLLIDKLQGKELPKPMPPMFEKIQQGEVWRLFTPALMHNDILHIAFNMIWLIVLGKQLEQRLSSRRYLLLILALGVFSNTCQYLMSGANFIGFSGILCGMLTFIAMRQKLTPWEGYPLQRSTFNFMMYFILAMFGIQLVSFFLEVEKLTSVIPGIANTAHLSGAALGAILGSLPFFSWKANPPKRPMP